MSEPATMRWRITLRCGCVWRVPNAPDMARPFICGVDDHGLVSIMQAERVEP